MLLIGCGYGRFLIAMNNIAPTMAIAMIIAAPMPRRYISVGGKLTTSFGDAVGAASDTLRAVSADELKYDFEPANVAIIVYSPGISGVQVFLNIPFESLVTSPM